MKLRDNESGCDNVRIIFSCLPCLLRQGIAPKTCCLCRAWGWRDLCNARALFLRFSAVMSCACSYQITFDLLPTLVNNFFFFLLFFFCYSFRFYRSQLTIIIRSNKNKCVRVVCFCGNYLNSLSRFVACQRDTMDRFAVCLSSTTFSVIISCGNN